MNKLKFDNDYMKNKVHITLQLSAESNKFLTESAGRSNRKKIPEATLRLEDHLKRYRSISEIDFVIPVDNKSNV